MNDSTPILAPEFARLAGTIDDCQNLAEVSANVLEAHNINKVRTPILKSRITIRPDRKHRTPTAALTVQDD